MLLDLFFGLIGARLGTPSRPISRREVTVAVVRLVLFVAVVAGVV